MPPPPPPSNSSRNMFLILGNIFEKAVLKNRLNLWLNSLRHISEGYYLIVATKLKLANLWRNQILHGVFQGS